LRQTTTPTDTLVKGVGQRLRSTGMLASPFRPSDDATTLPFLVPANAMVAVELNRTARLLTAVGQPDLAAQAQQLSHEIELAVYQWAVVQRSDGPVLAYEVDGFGNALFMDDANSPSLLSLPLLGFLSASDPLYVKTRALILR
jgi:meiotically up-regulated gene 157 (Mug157) protein